jgi:Protein of unknown function (DUF3379)
MTHDEARLLIGATPAAADAALSAHLAQCPDCTLFQQQMRRMDLDLARLMAAPLPPRADARVLVLPKRRAAAPATQPSGLLGLAASVVMAIGFGLVFWTLRPQPSLAAGVVGHVMLESDSWSDTAPMTAAASGPVLSAAGVAIDPTDTTVTYARICLFHGHWVPHLVIRTAGGPVTIMVMPQEHVTAQQSFRQNGYSGVLVPGPAGGALAVIAQGEPDMNAVTRALDAHLRWTH